MAKTRGQKVKEIEALIRAFDGAKGVVFANFVGLSVKSATALRRKCREAGVKYSVAKKTILGLALERAGVKNVKSRELEGGVAVVFGYSDEVAAAKLLHGFAAENPQIEFVGGLLPGETGWKFMDKIAVKAMAVLPTKQQLLQQVVNVINAPTSNFVNVLCGNIRGLIQVLKASAEAPGANTK